MRKIEDLVLLEKIGIILTIMAHDSDNELSKEEVGLILSEINSMLYTSGLEDTEYEHLLLNSDENAELNPLETMIGHFKSVQGTPASWELCQSLVKQVKEEIKDYDDIFKIWLRDVIIAVAGREGAMPSIIAGMVDIPVIGVPTSIGYGYGDKGISALMSMLQSCSLGIATVNIDSGIAAGVIASIIAKNKSIK